MVTIDRKFVLLGAFLVSTLFSSVAFPILALNLSQRSVSTLGVIRYQGTRTFGLVGVDWQDIYDSSLWKMVDFCRAKVLRVVMHFEPFPAPSDLVNIANIANANGVKLYLILASDGMTHTASSDWLQNMNTYKARIDTYQLENLRGNDGVYGYDICNEPDSYNVTRTGILVSALQYVKSKDPTHFVSVGLAPKWNDLPYAAYKEAVQAYVGQFQPYVDIIDVHCYAVNYYYQGALQREITQYFDDIVIPVAKGKPVQIGEMGIWTEAGSDLGLTASFTEQQQAEYFRLYGEISRPRNVLVFVYLIRDEPPSYGYPNFGLFRYTVDATTGMNTPKTAASLVYSYLSIG